MDGVHDLGGIQGFGPIEVEHSDALLKAGWGLRMFGIQLSASYRGGFSVDWIRHVAQCIPPAAYLEIEYWDRWYRMVAGVMLDSGWVSLEELASGKSADAPTGAAPPLPPDGVATFMREGMKSTRPAGGPEAFSAGDAVKAKFHAPLGPTRLPRYVRGHTGRIETFRGWHALPDAGALGEDRAEPLYSVSFLASAIWGDVTAPNDKVYLDLWESYLEPA